MHKSSRTPIKPLQCVPYARDHSSVKIYGDAYTWWDQAAGKYQRSSEPSAGAVMVLHDYAGPNRGHVAVVRALVSPREIRVDHANWLDDGSIYVNDPVEDVSSENDWTLVRVFNLKTRRLGRQGLSGPGLHWRRMARIAPTWWPEAAPAWAPPPWQAK